MQSIFRYATYYEKFIKGFAYIAAPLNILLQKDEAYKWSPDCDAAFETLTKAFSEIVTLGNLYFQKTFTIDTDAKDYCIGGVLSQNNKQNCEQPVAYFSRTLLKLEKIRSDA